ncbi:DUF2809 domain-containing protein [Paenibacillus sp. R14(2021)]|uniref:ribosomal maturation YjgA family protein n=1 Tax=Paenibacillus sp. R14(2021) TaxID=2859228 RepID=UPI002157ECB0|nr:DUF2809 domain-containing protein [Paenibacillus sp. R14(2021)]
MLNTRFGYGLSVLAAIVLGLGSRHYAHDLPDWLADHAGDALWACMVYFGCRLLCPGRSLRFAACTSLLFCCAIECSQLYQADWINAFRHTKLGGLVLGQGFLAVDFLRYTVGVIAALSMDGLSQAGRRRTADSITTFK